MENNIFLEKILETAITNIIPKDFFNAENNRPFFSVIVPCYNSMPERIKELLDSIINAGCPDITEVIISDDRSTDKTYLDIVEKYKDKFLNVIITEVPDINEDNIQLIHCPGNTRQNGVESASGQWITFIDHDDVFTENAFKIVKYKIEQMDEKCFICGSILHTDPQKDIIREELKYKTNWIHAKFYNLDNFWKKYNLHFKTNLFSNEDLALSSRINCICNRINRNIENDEDKNTVWIEDFLYVWRGWYDSTSNTIYDNQNYMERFFDDYLEAAMDTYVEYYNELLNNNELEQEDIDFQRLMQTDSILHMYFYLQSFKFGNFFNYDTRYEARIKYYIKEFYKRFNMDPYSFYDYIENFYGQRGKMYNDIRDSAKAAVGPFIEVDSFYDFISK